MKMKYNIKPGKYRHYKGNEYQVLGLALHSETLEEMVVYKALYGDGDLWVRPASMWEEEVTLGSETMLRFTPMDLQEEETKDKVEINKGLIELMGYGQHWNDVTYVPMEIHANEEICAVKMALVNLDQEITEVFFEGKHDDFMFDMEINDIKIRINLKTGVLRKLRERENDHE